MDDSGQVRSAGVAPAKEAKVRHKKILMILRTFPLVLSVLALALLLDACSRQAPELAADIIINKGKIVTVDGSFSIAEAVAVRGDTILAVGSQKAVGAYAGENTRTLDLNGAVMLPGIHDSHAHLAGWGMEQSPMHVDAAFPKVQSIADIARLVEEKVKNAPAGAWIEGGGWDEGYLEECKADKTRLPLKTDLDAVAPSHPVALTEYSGHRIWVNSKALALAKISKASPNPPGGEIQKDPATGEPTGLLVEKASALIGALIPPPTQKQQEDGIIAGMKAMNTFGITSVTDPGCAASLVALYNDLHNRGKFTVRMNLLLLLEGYGKPQSAGIIEQALRYSGVRTGFGNSWLRVAGYKVFGDGIPPLKTAWMYEPYVGGGVGGLVVKGENDAEREAELRAIIRLLHQNRYQIAIHGPGERTVDVCYDEFMKCLEADPWDARHYVVHCDFAKPETLAKIGAFNRRAGMELGINVQSALKWTIADHMTRIVGPERAAYMWPLRAMLDAGIRVTDSSDAPVTSPDFLKGIEAAVLRESKATRTPIGPEQSITVKEAIMNYTIHAAWQTHQESVKGSIEPGKYADFCIIDKDILTVDPHEISRSRVLATMVGGRIVYQANPGALRLQ